MSFNKLVSEALGIPHDSTEEQIIKAATMARTVQIKALTQEQEKLIDKVVSELIVYEAARPLVKKMIKLPADANEAMIITAVKQLLEDKDIKAALVPVGSKLTEAGEMYSPGLRKGRAQLI